MPQLHRPDPTPIDRALLGELGLYGSEFVDEPIDPISPVIRVTRTEVVVVNGIPVQRRISLIQSTNPNQPNNQKDPS
jgi:hypothetical protein